MKRLWIWLTRPRPRPRPITVNPDRTFTINDAMLNEIIMQEYAPPRGAVGVFKR